MPSSQDARTDDKFAPDALNLMLIRTAFIQDNGFALGAYQISAQDYADLLVARWEQLLGTIESPP